MVEKATSDLLIGPDWARNIEIRDMLNHDPGQAKDIVKGIKKCIWSKNSKVQRLALTFLETVGKNCGDIVHMHVAEKEIPHEMLDFHVKEKILILTDTWQEAFGGPRARYPQYYAAYQELLRAGAVFPKRSESSAPMFTPPQTQPLSSYPPNLRNPETRQETADASAEPEYPTLSSTEIQNAQGIMDVLAEMLSAIDPANKEIIGDLYSDSVSTQKYIPNKLKELCMSIACSCNFIHIESNLSKRICCPSLFIGNLNVSFTFASVYHSVLSMVSHSLLVPELKTVLYSCVYCGTRTPTPLRIIHKCGSSYIVAKSL